MPRWTRGGSDGESRQAEPLAQVAPPDDAAAIVAIGYCRQQDLGNVRAWIGKVPRRARKRVMRQCRKAGVDLP